MIKRIKMKNIYVFVIQNYFMYVHILSLCMYINLCPIKSFKMPVKSVQTKQSDLLTSHVHTDAIAYNEVSETDLILRG